MEANNHLWFIEYYHLPGLLCGGDAKRNCRSWRVGNRHKPFIHQLFIDIFFKEKIKARSFYCFIFRNYRRRLCIMAFAERRIYYYQRTGFIAVQHVVLLNRSYLFCGKKMERPEYFDN